MNGLEIEINCYCPVCKQHSTLALDPTEQLDCPECKSALCCTGFQVLKMWLTTHPYQLLFLFTIIRVAICTGSYWVLSFTCTAWSTFLICFGCIKTELPIASVIHFMRWFNLNCSSIRVFKHHNFSNTPNWVFTTVHLNSLFSCHYFTWHWFHFLIKSNVTAVLKDYRLINLIYQ